MYAGIYSMTYRGASGDWGMGMIVLQNGIVTGADTQGGLYDGSYREATDGLVLQLVLNVPPHVQLVQGTPPQPQAYKIPFTAVIPAAAIEHQTPVLVDLPPGPVNVILKRLRRLES